MVEAVVVLELALLLLCPVVSSFEEVSAMSVDSSNTPWQFSRSTQSQNLNFSVFYDLVERTATLLLPL